MKKKSAKKEQGSRLSKKKEPSFDAEQTQIMWDSLQEQKKSNWIQVMIIILTLITLVFLFLQTQTLIKNFRRELQKDSPRIDIELSSPKIPQIITVDGTFHHPEYFLLDYEDNIKDENDELMNEYAIPVKFTIYNLGYNPVKLEKIYYYFAGESDFKREFQFSKSTFRLINPGSEPLDIESLVFVKYDELPPKGEERYTRLKFVMEFDNNYRIDEKIYVKLK